MEKFKEEFLNTVQNEFGGQFTEVFITLKEIKEVFITMNFSQQKIDSIINILKSILLLEKSQFNDDKFDENSSPCSFKDQSMYL